MIKLLLILLLFSCGKSSLQVTKNQAVKNFDIEKYAGTWYEVARMENHTFQKECKAVILTYKAIKNGLLFLNECFDAHNNKLKEVTTRAFIKEPNIGDFTVFLYSIIKLEYKIIYVDKNYQNAIVEGQNGKYLWIISKNKNIGQQSVKDLTKKVSKLGYDTTKLIFI